MRQFEARMNKNEDKVQVIEEERKMKVFYDH